MRGEKQFPIGVKLKHIGSPPHARGKVVISSKRSSGGRITPACAGKSSKLSFFFLFLEDHPRMRGEKTKKIP